MKIDCPRDTAYFGELIGNYIKELKQLAAILSVVESCRRLKISVRDYLATILPGLADRGNSSLTAIPAGEWAMLFLASQCSAVSQIASGPSAYVR